MDYMMFLASHIPEQVHKYALLFFLFILFAVLAKKRDAISQWKEVLRSSIFNFGCVLINLVVTLPLITALQNNLLAYIPNFFGELWANTDTVVVIFFAVFFGDLIGYWRHRLEHSRLIWPAHATHHSDEYMTWLTLERFHPINYLTTFLIDTSILTLLGFPAYAVVANNMIRHYYGYFIHADLPWRYGMLGKIFVTPTMHRWHHAKDRAAHNTNFATVFSVFDRAFGTYRVPSKCNVPLGVSHKLGSSIIDQMLYPFKPAAYKRYLTAHKRHQVDETEQTVDLK